MSQIDRLLSSAVISYTGYGSAIVPIESPERLNAAIGQAMVSEYQKRVENLLEELNSFQADWNSMDLIEATKVVRNEMSALHPELSDEALDALAWSFSWWWR
jgi:hypothetical protein